MDWNWKGVLQAANQYGMNGYKPGTPQAPQGYVPYEATLNQRGLSNNMQPDNSVIPGTTYQPDNFGNRQPQAVAQMEAEQQAQAQAEQEALQKQQRIEEIEAEIAEIEQRIAERKRGMAANEDALNTQLAAIEARKINQKDPTSIWRWKAQMDENRRIANEQNKVSNSAKANALIEVANAVDNMIIDDRLDTPTANAMLSKLADYKTMLQKNGLPTSIVDEKIKKIKGEDNSEKNKGPENSEYSGRPKEQWDNEAKELMAKENLTQGDIMKFKQKNPILSDDVLLELNKKHNALIEKDMQIALNKRYEAARKWAGIDHSMWKLMSKAKRKEVLDKSGL